MRLLSVAVVAVALLLGAAFNANAADKAKKKAKAKPVTGAVSIVKKDEGKETGTFTVKVTAKKKKTDTTPAKVEEKTFTVTDKTKIEAVTGKKKAAIASAAKFSDLAEGKVVTITVNGDAVESVKIAAAKKTKKTK